MSTNALMKAITSKAHRAVGDVESLDPGAFNPHEFDSGLSIIDELRDNYRLYKEGQSAYSVNFEEPDAKNDGKNNRREEKRPPVPMTRVELSGFPASLQTPLDAIRARAFAGPVQSQPSETIITWIAAGHGVEAFYAHDVVEEAREVRREFYSMDFDDVDAQELIADWVRVCRVEVTTAGGSKARKVLRVPDPVAAELRGLAGELGVSVSSVGILAIALSLCQQEVTHEKHREQWAEQVAGFLRRIELRAKGVEALMGALGPRQIKVKGKGVAK